MRKAFTLIELLLVVALIAAMASLAIMSISYGESGARLKGGTRDVFSTVRLARLTAMACENPCVVTFKTEKTEDGVTSKIQIHAPDFKKATDGMMARTLGGEWRQIGEGEEEPAESAPDTRQAFVVSNRDKPSDRRSAGGGEGAASGGGAERTKELLFEEVQAEVFRDICIKVVMDDEEIEDGGDVDEAKRSMVSTFSNVDFILAGFNKQREEEKKAEEAQRESERSEGARSSGADDTADDEVFEKSIVWQANGRCDPFRLYVYSHGDKYTNGYVIRVDRYGLATVESDEEDER